MSHHNLMKHIQVFKAEHLKCCSFNASPQSEWLITAHLESGISILGSWTVDPAVLRPLEVAAVLRLGGKG